MKKISNITKEPFYSTTRRAGDFIFLSGFGPVDQQINVVGSSIEEQTAFTMNAMQIALESEGATWDDVVRVNVFLKDLADRDRFNITYHGYFKKQVPTRRLIGAGSLFKDILVEIDCIAFINSKKT